MGSIGSDSRHALKQAYFVLFLSYFDALWFHGRSPRTKRKAVFCEPFGKNHLLSDDDRNDVEVFIDILMDPLGVIPPVQNDVSKQKGWVAPPQFIEQEKNSLLIVHAGRGNDGCHGDAVDGSEVVGLVAHGIFVRMMPFPREWALRTNRLWTSTKPSGPRRFLKVLKVRKLEIDHDLPLLFNTGVQYWGGAQKD
jgi:hypothetical protein